MQVYGISDTLIKIYNIRNIESINIDNLRVVSSSKIELIPLLTVYYDHGKMLSLSSREKYFYSFVKKVTEVYNDEKNNIIEDKLTDPFKMRGTIKIDNHTKNILENGKLTELNSIYEFYNDKFSYDNSLLFQIDEVKLLFPIIKYHIEDLFNKTNKKVILNNDIQGYRDSFISYASVNGLNKVINILFSRNSDNDYTFIVSGLLKSPLEINIRFLNDRINVFMNNKELNCEYTYLTNNEKVKQIISISKNYLNLFYDNKDLKECENIYKNITDLDNETNFKWFYLPWGSLYGINNSIYDLNSVEKIIKTYSMYINVNDNGFIKKENYSKTYKRISSSLNTESVVLDDAIKNTMCFCISKTDNIYAIETAFLDTRYPDAYYQEFLENKYFYHIFKSKLDEVNKDKLISINNDSVLFNTDLVNENKALSLIKGDK